MRVNRSLFHQFGILLLGSAAAMTGSATVLFNNLSDTPTSSNGIYGNGSGTNGSVYQSFSNGATGLLLDDLQLELAGAVTSTGSFTIGLYSDLSTKPNTLLLTIASVNDSSIALSPAVYDFSVANYSLSANTRYWIGLVGTSTSSHWEGTPVQAGDTGTSTEFIQQTTGVVYPSNANFAYMMEVTAVSAQSGVPEPATMGLMALGLGGLGVFLRRKRLEKGD
jgi:hypothetical protein